MAALNPRLADLSNLDRLVLESWLVEFDQRWDEGLFANRVEQIPPGSSWRLPALADMVKIDLERQWQRGRQVSLESYLKDFPELGNPADVSADLIQAEYEVRRQFGAPAALEDYLRRFPHQAGELAMLIAKGGSKLALIPAGEFVMGSPDSDKDAQDDGKPQHRVRITRPFYLGATEVTVGQFRRVVASAGYQTEAEKDGKGGVGWNEAKGTSEQDPKYTWRNPGFAQTDEHPVVNVSWNDAIAYCNLLSDKEGLKREDGYRLPTEAEWEYACRARTTTRYQSGDDSETLAEVGNIADGTLKAKGGVFVDWTTITARDGYVFTPPVGRFRPNAFGLYDMHGNVWEWCWDGYDAKYYAASPSPWRDCAVLPGPRSQRDARRVLALRPAVRVGLAWVRS